MLKHSASRFSEIKPVELDTVAGGLRVSQLEHLGSHTLSVDPDRFSDAIDLDGASSVDGISGLHGSTTTSSPRADYIIVGAGGAGTGGLPGAGTGTTSLGGTHLAGPPGAGSVTTGVGGAGGSALPGAGIVFSAVGGAHGELLPGAGSTTTNVGGLGTSGWGSYSSALSGLHNGGLPGAGSTTNGGGGFSFWHTPTAPSPLAGIMEPNGNPGANSTILNGQPIGTGTGLANNVLPGTGVTFLPGVGYVSISQTPPGVGQVTTQGLPSVNQVITHAPPAPTTRLETGLAADVFLEVDWNAGRTTAGVPNGALDVLAQLGRGGVAIPPGQMPVIPPPRNGGGGFFGGLFDDPLLLDLDNNGVQLTSVQDGVMFDINGDGTQERVAWTQSGDRAEAWLVRDDSHDGGAAGIQSGLELFGDQHGDANGFARLSTYDSNKDGVFNAQDEAFDEVQLWRDANHNGVSEEGEMVSLASEGIVSINVTPTSTNESALGNGNRAIYGSFTREVPV